MIKKNKLIERWKSVDYAEYGDYYDEASRIRNGLYALCDNNIITREVLESDLLKLNQSLDLIKRYLRLRG